MDLLAKTNHGTCQVYKCISFKSGCAIYLYKQHWHPPCVCSCDSPIHCVHSSPEFHRHGSTSHCPSIFVLFLDHSVLYVEHLWLDHSPLDHTQPEERHLVLKKVIARGSHLHPQGPKNHHRLSPTDRRGTLQLCPHTHAHHLPIELSLHKERV